MAETREYYIQKYNEVYENFLANEGKSDPMAQFDITEDRWNADVVIGYYLDVHGEDAYADWCQYLSYADDGITDREKAISGILKELDEKWREKVKEKQDAVEKEMIDGELANDLCDYEIGYEI